MRRALTVLPVCLLACGGPAHHGKHGHHGKHHAPHHQHRFDDAEHWAKRFDAPERDAWQKPSEVVAALKVAPEALVADIGAGTGYFAVHFARTVTAGKVFGVDIEKAMVDHMRKRAAEAGLANLEPVLSVPDDPSLPTAVDLAFICNTYHHIEDREGWMGKLRAQLKPGGRVAVVDYSPDFDGPGPPPAMRLPAETVVSEMKSAGFALAHRDDDLLPRQYLLVFTPEG